MQPSCSCPAQLYQKPLQIESGASDTAVWSVHTEKHADFKKIIVFFRNTLTRCEKNYSVYDGELLAVATCFKAWHPYIDGQKTILITYKGLNNLC